MAITSVSAPVASRRYAPFLLATRDGRSRRRQHRDSSTFIGRSTSPRRTRGSSRLRPTLPQHPRMNGSGVLALLTPSNTPKLGHGQGLALSERTLLGWPDEGFGGSRTARGGAVHDRVPHVRLHAPRRGQDEWHGLQPLRSGPHRADAPALALDLRPATGSAPHEGPVRSSRGPSTPLDPARATWGLGCRWPDRASGLTRNRAPSFGARPTRTSAGLSSAVARPDRRPRLWSVSIVLA